MKINLGKTKMMVSGSKGEISKSKVDPCGICGKRVMRNSMMCTVCKKWIHGRCAKVKKVNNILGKSFICSNCINTVTAEQTEELCSDLETVDAFSYFGDRINASGECEVAVTARVRAGWKKFRECEEILRGRRFPLKIKGKVYRCCIRPAILYGSKTWCLKESEMAILRTERAKIRAMCGVKNDGEEKHRRTDIYAGFT